MYFPLSEPPGRGRAAGPMRVGLLFALLAAVSMVLGLMGWPSVHWELPLAWGAAAETSRHKFCPRRLRALGVDAE